MDERAARDEFTRAIMSWQCWEGLELPSDKLANHKRSLGVTEEERGSYRGVVSWHQLWCSDR